MVRRENIEFTIFSFFLHYFFTNKKYTFGEKEKIYVYLKKRSNINY